MAARCDDDLREVLMPVRLAPSSGPASGSLSDSDGESNESTAVAPRLDEASAFLFLLFLSTCILVRYDVQPPSSFDTQATEARNPHCSPLTAVSPCLHTDVWRVAALLPGISGGGWSPCRLSSS